MKRIFIGLLLLLLQPLMASVVCSINSTELFSCEFSRNHHNRILIEEGRIKKIIFPEDQLHVRLEQTSGQGFIQAKHPSLTKVLISVISQDGLVQDIEIEFKDRPSQVVVLKRPEDCISVFPLHQTTSADSSTKNSLVAIISSFLRGEVPGGYCSCPISSSSWKVRLGVQASLKGCFQGKDEEIYLYRVTNRSFWKKGVSEKDFNCTGQRWVYLRKRSLRRKESALVIVAVQR